MVLFKYVEERIREVDEKIYIPLWSYSNSDTINIIEALIIFTFHYGPIQIL